MHRPSLIAGIIFAALSVALGAFGAHGLKEIASADALATYNTAATYQMYHALALLVCGVVYSAFPVKALRIAYKLFTAGILCFSGSLYVVVWAKINTIDLGLFNLITPFGGLLFIGGWLAFLAGNLKAKRSPSQAI